MSRQGPGTSCFLVVEVLCSLCRRGERTALYGALLFSKTESWHMLLLAVRGATLICRRAARQAFASATSVLPSL